MLAGGDGPHPRPRRLQLLAVAQKLGRKHLLYWGVLVGLFAGIATDFVVVAAGA